MAKENSVYLLGRARTAEIRKEEKSGNYKSGKIYLDVIRRTFATSDMVLQGQPRWDTPCVYSRNNSVIKNGIKNVAQGDIPLIKGSLCSKNASRRFVCKKCGHIQDVPGAVLIYVDPVFVRCMEKGLDETKAYETVRNCFEVSNDVSILGTCCIEPGEHSYYKDRNARLEKFEFVVAINRVRHILEDEPEKKVDYIHIKCYGKECANYAENIHIGSTVLIKGAIQTREGVNAHSVCENCGDLITKKITATEIVPYRVEYVDKCGSEYEPIDISGYKEVENYVEE